MPDFSRAISKNDFQRFSPQKTLFIIGPTEEHSACKMQRRLVKPALAALIRDDISVMEVYGEETPTKNGEPLDWLDPSLLRHAMDAEQGFLTIYVDAKGRTVFRSEAPIPTADLLKYAGIDAARSAAQQNRSKILKELSAA